MINSLPVPQNYQFKQLPASLVNQINSIEGNGMGTTILAILLDMALSGAVTPAASQAAQGAAGAIVVADNTQASINAALVTAVADINSLGTKVNAVIAALKTAGLMVSP